MSKEIFLKHKARLAVHGFRLVNNVPVLHDEFGKPKSNNPADHERWLAAYVAEIEASNHKAVTVIEPTGGDLKRPNIFSTRERDRDHPYPPDDSDK